MTEGRCLEKNRKLQYTRSCAMDCHAVRLKSRVDTGHVPSPPTDLLQILTIGGVESSAIFVDGHVIYDVMWARPEVDELDR